jgi:hypothetical protein
MGLRARSLTADRAFISKPSGERRTERWLWFAVELRQQRSSAVNNIIYIVGLVVVVIAVLSFFGLR